MVHVPSADLSPEELAQLRFLAARHFRNLGPSSTKFCSHGPSFAAMGHACVFNHIMGMGSSLISLLLDTYIYIYVYIYI